MKKYIAKSQVAVSIQLPNGTKKHVSFLPKTTGGSVYYSDNVAEQKGLESHPRFGRLFKIDPFYRPAQQVVKKAEVKPAPKKESAIKQIKVSDLAAAKDYLCDRFGISRTKLRSKAAILEGAAANGIEFIGI